MFNIVINVLYINFFLNVWMESYLDIIIYNLDDDIVWIIWVINEMICFLKNGDIFIFFFFVDGDYLEEVIF